MGDEQSTNDQEPESDGGESLKGFICAASAFLIWGLSPIYWKTLNGVPPFEIVLHRVVWSFFFLIPLIPIQNRTTEFLSALKSPRALLTLLATTLFVATKWLPPQSPHQAQES